MGACKSAAVLWLDHLGLVTTQKHYYIVMIIIIADHMNTMKMGNQYYYDIMHILKP